MMPTANGSPTVYTLALQMRIFIYTVTTIVLCGITFCSGLLAYRVRVVEEISREHSERIENLEKASETDTP